jgi:hypothetical protein
MGHAGGLFDLVIPGAEAAIGDVVPDRAVEQRSVLGSSEVSWVTMAMEARSES